MPGRGGDSHHPRRPFGAVLSLGAFIGMPSVGCGCPVVISIPSSSSRAHLFTASQTISQSAATAKNHDDANTERPLPQPVVIT